MAPPKPDEAAIFNVARRIHAADARQHYLNQACAGDRELQDRLEALLRVNDRDRSFLEAPAEDVPARTVDPIAEGPGTQIGPYKLLEKIGEGGFGKVFMAEQTQPIRRMVALKIIKPGMDTQQVVARFESERQVLALMSHPNIAQIIDGGETASGRPYFVMELVRGVPITEFCDKNHLSAKDRLKLFTSVCHAIQHAHYKGVIHRDIKPSNVMVTLHDGVPVVKIIDFGVAKATDQKLTEKTLFTSYGQMIGTPAYMSPEQAEMSGLDIDTRTDVYSLGVLLYELLTGTTPLDAVKLRAAGYAEIQRLIREQEPPRPSTRLSSLGDSATILAGNRATDLKQLMRLLSGDLDWIVMKALEKDRNRRYATPGSFADDIERYLRRDVIEARPPSAGYRFRKFVQRHRGGVVAASLIAAALLIGAGVAAWQAIVATHAKQDALSAASAEKTAKDTALAKEAEARAALDFVENKVFGAAKPKARGGLGADVGLRAALEGALPFVEKSFGDQPLVEARLRMTLGYSFFHIGDGKSVAMAAEQFQTARRIYSQQGDDLGMLRAMMALANCYHDLGRPRDALALNEEVLELRKAKLGPADPETIRVMNNVAVGYYSLARPADARKLYEETLALQKTVLGQDHRETLMTMHNLAACYALLGQKDEALALRKEIAASMKARLGAKDPETLNAMISLAESYAAAGQNADALRVRQETLTVQQEELGQTHRNTLRTMHALANSYAALGQHAEALQRHQETLALREAHLGADDADTLTSRTAVARDLMALNRGAEAVPIIDDCLRRAAGNIAVALLLPELIELRLRHFQKANDPAGCRETAEMWERMNLDHPSAFYYAARYRAVAATVLRAARQSPDADADKAMEWLRQAVAAEFGTAAAIRKEKDFEALHERPDFKKLLAELEAGAENKK